MKGSHVISLVWILREKRKTVETQSAGPTFSYPPNLGEFEGKKNNKQSLLTFHVKEITPLSKISNLLLSISSGYRNKKIIYFSSHFFSLYKPNKGKHNNSSLFFSLSLLVSKHSLEKVFFFFFLPHVVSFPSVATKQSVNLERYYSKVKAELMKASHHLTCFKIFKKKKIRDMVK